MNEISGVGGWDSQMSETQLVDVLNYALEKLFRGVYPKEDGVLPPPPPCNVILFYRNGRAPSAASIYDTVLKINEYNIAATIVPVYQLNHPNTFLSIVAVRHE